VTKPKIGALGLNFQHCAHVVYFPSHSFEQYYQAVRRCWRFGQTKPVSVDIILTEGERRIMENLSRKEAQAAVMFDNMVAEMVNATSIDTTKNFASQMEVPAWAM
jgi:SNF2 family DNA or RNA helicase